MGLSVKKRLKMDTKEVTRLIKEAGFKSKAEFAKAMNLTEVAVNFWGNKTQAPAWLKQVLEWSFKARKYDEMKRLFEKNNF